MGWHFIGHLITDRSVKDLSLDFFTQYLLSMKPSQEVLQLNCHLITGRYVKDLSPENVLPHIVLV